MNDDTVIGVLRGSVPAKIRLSDLDDPYKWQLAMSMKFKAQRDELEAQLAKAEDEVEWAMHGERLALKSEHEMSDRLAKAEAALGEAVRVIERMTLTIEVDNMPNAWTKEKDARYGALCSDNPSVNKLAKEARAFLAQPEG